MTVPVPIPTTDGRLFVDGLVVMNTLKADHPRLTPTGVAWQARFASCIG